MTLDPAGGPQPVSFEFRPLNKGRHSYTVRVPPVAGERIVENNQRSAVASVDQAELHVLYVEGTLRAEYGALVNRFLAKDPDLGFCALVQTRPNLFLRRTNMPDLRLAAVPTEQAAFDKFEVFILGDLDSIFLRPAQQEMLLQRVRAGAGLLMLGGYHSLGPGGYGGTPLGRALPVELGEAQFQSDLTSYYPDLLTYATLSSFEVQPVPASGFHCRTAVHNALVHGCGHYYKYASSSRSEERKQVAERLAS